MIFTPTMIFCLYMNCFDLCRTNLEIIPLPLAYPFRRQPIPPLLLAFSSHIAISCVTLYCLLESSLSQLEKGTCDGGPHSPAPKTVRTPCGWRFIQEFIVGSRAARTALRS
jgi:hypothetical protein